MTKRPWLFGAVIGVVFAVLWGTVIFHGSLTERLALGAMMGLFWGAGQGMVASYHNDRRGQEAAERERLASSPPPPPWAYAPRPAPTGRYRTAEATRWLAIVGALVAAANAAAQLSPEGGFTVEGLTVTAPSIDHAGWAIVAAMMVGVLIAAIATVLAGRRLTRAPLPPTPGDAPERHPTVLVVGFGAAGMFVAALQWLGLVPAIGSLAMVMLGCASVVAGVAVAIAVSRFEQRTGQVVLSTSPISKTLGLEARLFRL